MELLQDYATSTVHAFVNQDIIIMYAFAPLIALFVYILFKLLSHFKW